MTPCDADATAANLMPACSSKRRGRSAQFSSATVPKPESLRAKEAEVQLLDVVNVSGQEQRQPHLHHRGVANTLLVRAPGSHAAQCDAFRRPSQNPSETLCQIELLVIFRHHQTQDECRIAIGDQVAAKLLHAAPERSQGNMAYTVYNFCSRARRGPGLRR